MRIKKLLITAVISFLAAFLLVLVLRHLRPPSDEPANPPGEVLPEAVVVYCLHDDLRGPECRRIEKLTHEVLKKDFGRQLERGQLRWFLVNYENPHNAILIDQYEIIKPCIVVIDGRPGKGRAWKNLQQKVWELIDDERAFKDYIRGEIQEALK